MVSSAAGGSVFATGSLLWAYARASTDSADQLVSLDAQKEHYEQVIKNCPNWEFAGLYYDEGVSGTKMAKRDGLLRMLADCERGLIDYILVKSISRFSRNTVESVETVRRLSAMGIYIFFEKENIDTGKMEGELRPRGLPRSTRHTFSECHAKMPPRWQASKRLTA